MRGRPEDQPGPRERDPYDAVQDIAFSSDGRRVVSGSWDGTAQVWDISTTLNAGAAGRREVFRLTHNDDVNAVGFSPDGKWVVSGSWDNTD